MRAAHDSLMHQKDKNLAGINAKLDATGFRNPLPPEATEVVSWSVMMRIGRVVTLSLPATKLRDVNLAIEQCALAGGGTGGVRHRVLRDLRFPAGLAAHTRGVSWATAAGWRRRAVDTLQCRSSLVQAGNDKTGDHEGPRSRNAVKAPL